MTIIHYDETSEFGQDMLDLIALLGWMMDEEQAMNKGAVNSSLRIAQGKIQRIRDRIRKEKGVAYFEGDGHDTLRDLQYRSSGSLLHRDIRRRERGAHDIPRLHRLRNGSRELCEAVETPQYAGVETMIPEGLLVLMPNGYGRMMYRAQKGYEDMCLIRNWCGSRKLTDEQEYEEWRNAQWLF